MPEGVYALANILMYPLPLLPVFSYVTFPKSFTHNGLEYLLYGRNIGGYVYFGGGGWGGGLKILQWGGGGFRYSYVERCSKWGLGFIVGPSKARGR